MLFQDIKSLNEHLNALSVQYTEHSNILNDSEGDTVIAEKNSECMVIIAISDAVEQLMRLPLEEMLKFELSVDSKEMERFIYDSISEACWLALTITEDTFTVVDLIQGGNVISVSNDKASDGLLLVETSLPIDTECGYPLTESQYDKLRVLVYERYKALLPRRSFLFT